MSQVVSYAQNREDMIISGFFTDVSAGFYVDIGANDPVHDSVTKYFYDRGWRGINVEPIPSLFKKLKKARPRDINLQIGIGARKGSATLNYYPDGDGLSTFSEEMAGQYKDNPTDITRNHEEFKADVLPLKTVLEQHAAGKTIHFMKIDVEGYEAAVIAGNDWAKYRPQLICIEANHIFEGWEKTLKENKYKKVFFDGLNNYYLAAEASFREEQFSYVQTIIGQNPINYHTAEKIARLQSSKQKAERYDALVELNQIHEQRVQTLEKELTRPRTIKEAVRISLRSLHYATLAGIESLKPRLEANDFTTNEKDPKKMIQALQHYDVENERIVNNKLSLRVASYLALSNLYSGIIALVKFLERIARGIIRRIKR